MNNRPRGKPEPEKPLSASDQKRVDTLQQEHRALTLDHELVQTWGRMRADWWRLGEIFHAVTKEGLWRVLKDGDGHRFETIDGWLMDRIPEVGRSALYAARKAYEELSPHISRQELEKIPLTNTKLLALLPERERGDKKWVRAAQELTETELSDKLEKEKPDLHVEGKRPMKLKPAKSQRSIYDEALEVMAWALETPNREQCLEAICEHFLQSPCDNEQYEGLTNRQAYAKAHGEKVKAAKV